MIARLERVTGMELTPQACVLCGNNPVDEVTGLQQDAVFAPGVDVNWGDSVYVCKSCCEIIADLFDRVSEEEYEAIKTRLDRLDKAHKALEKKYDKAKNILERIGSGRKAEREAA